jgi:predicted dehydrogenase
LDNDLRSGDHIKVAVVGCGIWAQETHLPCLLSQPSVKLVGIVDTAVGDRRAEIAKKYRPDVMAESIQGLLEQVYPDCIIISVPYAYHFSFAWEALQAGLHVHVDKPLCSSPGEIDELVSLADKKGLVISTHAQRKYMPGQVELRKYLTRHFKRIQCLICSLWQPLFDDYVGSWRANRQMALGGVLMDSGYHLVDTALNLLGATKRNEADELNIIEPNLSAESDSFASLIFREGATVVHVTTCRGLREWTQQERYEICGDGGFVQLSYIGKGANKICKVTYMNSRRKTIETQQIPMLTAFQSYPLLMFLQAIQGKQDARKAIRTNVELARLTVDIIQKATPEKTSK